MVETSMPPIQGGMVGTLVEDIVVLSNRQPYQHHRDDDSVAVDQPTGGLATGLDPVLQRLKGTWIAVGQGEIDFDVLDDDGCVEVPPDDPRYTLRRLHLTEAEIDGYYRGYANQMLWPLCHGMSGKMRVRPGDWETYRSVNESFADAAEDAGGAVWFQDYHLALAPAMVAQDSPDQFIMHFWHIPWPDPGTFGTCPQAEAIIEGLLGNDLIIFHTEEYAMNFLRSAARIIPEQAIDWSERRLHHDRGMTSVLACPLGTDAETVRRNADVADGTFWADFADRYGIDESTRIILGVDRLDYTKGIELRLEALEHLLAEHPDWRGELTYIQKGSKSRSNIAVYADLQQRVADQVEAINDRFGTDDWDPIVYTTEFLPEVDLAALYRQSDIALVTPLRDGMNLVAQEYVAAQTADDAALVLSEFAGATTLLGDDAIVCNPYDIAETVSAIDTALTMPTSERTERCLNLRKQVHAHNIDRWVERVFDAAVSTRLRA